MYKDLGTAEEISNKATIKNAPNSNYVKDEESDEKDALDK